LPGNRFYVQHRGTKARRNPTPGPLCDHRRTVSHLIGIAYGVSMQVLDTGPDWIQRGDLRFDVQAKAENPASATRQQLLTMLQNLLVERFQMKFHYVTKEEQGFALVVAKNGPKLHTSTSEDEKLTFLGPNGEELPKPMAMPSR